jgi:hypothetical protein
MNTNYFPPIPVLQIRPGALLCYDVFTHKSGRYRDLIKIPNLEPEAPQLYTGKLSDYARKNLKFAINLLIEQAKWKEVQHPSTGKFYSFKVNFITLTLSAKQRDVSDKTIKNQMLAPWIRIMRDTFKLRSYVWRAERQRNGNIHFHFITDTYILYSDIRDNWNSQQAKFHFIDEFRNRNNSEFPNSTDVHSVQQIRNLAAYLVKYMSKDEKGLESIEGKVWDCSSNLKTKERCAYEMSGADFKIVDKMCATFKDRLRRTDNCLIIPLSQRELARHLPPAYIREYKAWLDRVYQNAPSSRYK